MLCIICHIALFAVPACWRNGIHPAVIDTVRRHTMGGGGSRVVLGVKHAQIEASQ